MEIDRSANNDDANGHNDPDELADSGELEMSAAGNAATDPEDSDELEASASGNTTATADLEELVRYVASKLVHNPEEVTVDSETRAGTVYVNLRVPEEEMGRVIGREGRTAKAIRTLVSIAGSRHNVHARLDIDG